MRLKIYVFFLIFFPISALASSMSDAVEDAVEKLKDSGKLEIGLPILVNPVVNAHSGKSTDISRMLETKLVLTISDAFPDIKVESASESIAGASLRNKVILQSTVEPKGSEVTLRIQAIRNVLDGEVLASALVQFEQKRKIRKTVVAVLDIEASFLDSAQRRSVSDYLKSKLVQHSNFSIASSSEIAKYDPDQVQKAYECTREECAVIIGEQMGVDRVVSTSMVKTAQSSYFFSSRLVNIQTSENLVITTREFKGNPENISQMFPAINEMAMEIAGKRVDQGGGLFGSNQTSGFSGSASIQRITPKVTGNRKSNIAALFLNTQPQGADVYIGSLKLGKTPFSNLKMTAGKTLLITLKHPDYLDKRIEVTLSGGINRADTIHMQSRYGMLNVESEPTGAEVTIAGQIIGKTPIQNYRIASGNYLISLSKEYYFPVDNQQFKVDPGQNIQKNYTLKANFGTLDLDSHPQEANFSILNKEGEIQRQGKTPSEFRMDAGKYTVRLTKPGYDTLDFQVAIPLGKTVEIFSEQAKLRELTGTVIVSSEPYEDGAEVFFDGKKIGTIPGEFVLPAGQHTIRVESGYKDGSIQVNIEDQQIQAISVPIMNKFSREEMKSTHSLWTAGLYGSFLGSAGMVYYSMSENAAVKAANEDKLKYYTLAQSASTYAEAQSYLDKASSAESAASQHQSNAQTAQYIAIGTFALGTYLYFNEPANPDELAFAPVVLPNTYGLALKSRF